MNSSIIPIILAAGKSGRFGSENKLLYKITTKSILEMTLSPFIENFDTIIVIIGAYKSEMINYLSRYNTDQVFPIFNDEWKSSGMSSSIKKGIQFIQNKYKSQGVLIHPGDIPFITSNDLQVIITEVEQEKYQKIIIPEYKLKHGHPVFIPSFLFSETLSISEQTEGLRGFMIKNDHYKKYVICSEGILKDIDKKEDL